MGRRPREQKGGTDLETVASEGTADGIDILPEGDKTPEAMEEMLTIIADPDVEVEVDSESPLEDAVSLEGDSVPRGRGKRAAGAR